MSVMSFVVVVVVITTTLWGRNYHYLILRDEEAETQRLSLVQDHLACKWQLVF